MEDLPQKKAKSLIDTFEKGQILAENGVEYPEKRSSEIASPGTAKNLRSMFEKNAQADAPPPIIRKKKAVVLNKEKTTDVTAGEKKEGIVVQKPSRKRVLLVYAADDEGSLEHNLVDTAKRHFEETGCDVVISDLHGQKFNPIVSRLDIVGCVSVAHAYESGHLAEDIVKEQEKLSSADVVIFIFAQYMHGLPAIIKGWFDRVLCVKYAYDVDANAIFDNGMMRGKKALVCQTLGGPSSLFTSHGILGDLNVYLYPLEWAILRFCGFDVLQTQLYFNTAIGNESLQESHLTDWRGRLEGIWLEHPKQFLSLSQFEADKGYDLGETAKLDLGTRSIAASVGHHLGKPIPAFLPPPDINAKAAN